MGLYEFHIAQYPKKIPVPTTAEIRAEIEEEDIKESQYERAFKPRKFEEVDLDLVFKRAEEYTKDKHIQFSDKMLEIGKRRDNTHQTYNEEIGIKKAE